MKTKSFISLLCLTLGMFLFQACNDVPSPYDIPGKGDANSCLLYTSDAADEL